MWRSSFTARSAYRSTACLCKARQFPHAGAGRIDVGRDIDVDQIGLVGIDPLAHGRGEIGGAIHANSLDAGGARHRGEVRIVTLAGFRVVEVGRELTSAEIAVL